MMMTYRNSLLTVSTAHGDGERKLQKKKKYESNRQYTFHMHSLNDSSDIYPLHIQKEQEKIVFLSIILARFNLEIKSSCNFVHTVSSY